MSSDDDSGGESRSSVGGLVAQVASAWATLSYLDQRLKQSPLDGDLLAEVSKQEQVLELLLTALKSAGKTISLEQIRSQGIAWFVREIGTTPKMAAARPSLWEEKQANALKRREQKHVKRMSEEKQRKEARRFQRELQEQLNPKSDRADEVVDRISLVDELDIEDVDLDTPLPVRVVASTVVSRDEKHARMCADFIYMCAQAYKIPYRPGMNPDFPHGGFGPFILTEAQGMIVAEMIDQLLIKRKPLRMIILKSRQLGCTTLLLAFWVWLCLTFPHFKVLFIIDKGKHGVTKKIQIQKWLEDISKEYPLFPSIEKRDDGYILFTNGSMILFESAEAPNPGTSEMINVLHESEKPKWPKNRAQEVQTSILPGIPFAQYTAHVNESTAEGMEHFYMEWTRAVDNVGGADGYTPIFIPWYISREYSSPAPPDFQFLNQDDEVSDVDSDGETLISEEQYANRYRLSKHQVFWRRRKIKVDFKGNRNAFDQEYPTTPEHAWRQTSTSFFPREKLDRAQILSVKAPMFRGRLENQGGDIEHSRPCLYSFAQPVVVPDRMGSLQIWSSPIADQEYFLGGDTAEGKTIITDTGNAEPDWTVFVVRNSYGRMVAMYREQIKPEEAWVPLLLLGVLYNLAWTNVERNGPGKTLLSWFYQTGYPHNLIFPKPAMRPVIERMWVELGKTNRITVLSQLRASYNADYSRIVSEDLLREARSFIVDPRTGKVGAQSNCHDDIIFADAHCEYVRLFQLGLLAAYGVDEQQDMAQVPDYFPTKDPRSDQFAGYTLEMTDLYAEEDEYGT